MGVDFTMIPGKGPKIINPISTENDIEDLKLLSDVDNEVPFLRPILQVSAYTELYYPFQCYYTAISLTVFIYYLVFAKRN